MSICRKETAQGSTSLKKQLHIIKKLSYRRGTARRSVSWNLANYSTTVWQI